MATTSRALIDELLAERSLALCGASRKKKFGNTILKELVAKGYRVQLVHPEADSIDGVACVRSLAELREPVGAVVVVVPPAQAEQILRDAAAAGIKRVWLQQGSESEEVVRLGEELGLAVVHGHCILMFAEPAIWIHRLHRFFKRMGKSFPR
jgi:hypothetical protein